MYSKYKRSNRNLAVLCCSCLALIAFFTAGLSGNSISVQQFRNVFSSSSDTQDIVTPKSNSNTDVDSGIDKLNSTTYNHKSLLNRANQAFDDRFKNPSINSLDNTVNLISSSDSKSNVSIHNDHTFVKNQIEKSFENIGPQLNPSIRNKYGYNHDDKENIDSNSKQSLNMITFEFDFVCRDYNQFCHKNSYSCKDILNYVSLKKNNNNDAKFELLTNDRFYFLSLRREIIFNILKYYNYNYNQTIENIENNMQSSCVRRLLSLLSFVNNNYYHYPNPTRMNTGANNMDMDVISIPNVKNNNGQQQTPLSLSLSSQSLPLLSKWHIIHISKNGGTTMRSTFEQAVKLYNAKQNQSIKNRGSNMNFKAGCNTCLDILRGVTENTIAQCQCDAMMKEMNENNIQVCSNERPLISDAICRNMRNFVVIREPIEHVLSYLFFRTWYGATKIQCICKQKQCLDLTLPHVGVFKSINDKSVKSKVIQKNVTFGEFYSCDSISNSLKYFIKDIIGFVNILDSKNDFNDTIDNKIEKIFSQSPPVMYKKNKLPIFILPNIIARNMSNDYYNNDIFESYNDKIEWEIDWNVSNSHFVYGLKSFRSDGITQTKSFNYYQIGKNYVAWLNNLQTRYFGISEIPQLEQMEIELNSNPKSTKIKKTINLDKSTARMLYLTGKDVNQDMAQQMIANCQKILLAIDCVVPMQNYGYAKETTFDTNVIDEETIKKNWDYTLKQIEMSLNITNLEWISENSQSNRYVPGKTLLTSKSIFDGLTEFEKNLLYEYNKLDTQLFQLAMKIAMADNLFYYFQLK